MSLYKELLNQKMKKYHFYECAHACTPILGAYVFDPTYFHTQVHLYKLQTCVAKTMLMM